MSQETFAQEVLPQLDFPNVFEYQAVTQLPQGIAYPVSEEGSSGIDQVGLTIQQIINGHERLKYSVPREWLDPQNRRILIGQILSNIAQPNMVTRVVIDKLMEQYPHIHWLRGGSLRIQNNIPVLDETVQMADGLLGDLSAFSYALKGYDGKPRENPVLYAIALSSLVAAAQQRIISVGSHHLYDVSLGIQDREKFAAWSTTEMKIFKVPMKEEDQQQMVKLLSSKAIVS